MDFLLPCTISGGESPICLVQFVVVILGAALIRGATIIGTVALNRAFVCDTLFHSVVQLYR